MPMQPLATTIGEQLDLTAQDRAAGGDAPLVFYIASVADEVPVWWSPARDRALGQFWWTEPVLAGAIYSICAKIAALGWTLTGPERQVRRYQAMLAAADLGAGWAQFILKVVQDVLTQDNGAFIELLRAPGEGPDTPVRGVAYLDSQRCTRTGDPLYPVIYTSARTGERHKLAWWQVATLADLPSGREEMRGVGFCAVSRVLRAAQVLRDISLYKRQKVSGKRVPGIIFVQGVRRGVVEDGLKAAVEEQRSQGLSHYTTPIVISSPDPSVPVKAELMELASLPDGYDEDTSYRWYICQLALGFGVDYGEFAPLPGAALGTATQSEVQAAKARGKGPGILIQMLEHIVNWTVLPPSVTFSFSSQDLTEDLNRAKVTEARASALSRFIHAGILTPEQALQVAVDWGELPQAFLTRDITPNVSVTDLAPAAAAQASAPSSRDLPHEPQTRDLRDAPPSSGEAAKQHDEDLPHLLDAYRTDLQAAYDAWAATAAEDLSRDRSRLPELLALLLLALKGVGERHFHHAFEVGLQGAEPDAEALRSLHELLARNEAYLTDSLIPDLRGRLEAVLPATAEALRAALQDANFRILQYVGALGALYWLGWGASRRGVPVRRSLDPLAEHCDTCPPKAKEYANFETMVREAGIPGDGSDACGSNCRCRLEFLVNGVWLPR